MAFGCEAAVLVARRLGCFHGFISFQQQSCAPMTLRRGLMESLWLKKFFQMSRRPVNSGVLIWHAASLLNENSERAVN
jgi:hypothetical protein